MKIKAFISIILFLIVSLFLISATKKIFAPTPIILDIPTNFPPLPNKIFAKNPLTEQGFLLGKKLFFDASLSKTNDISCASCHQPFAAFANYYHDFSHGVNNSFTTRNAPSLVNLLWMKNWHWDGGVNHLEVQPLSPLTAPNEMGQHLDTLLNILKQNVEYKNMFAAAFGDEKITSQRMLWALNQFTGSLISANSKYDLVKNGNATFIEPEQKGYELFKANCNSCHKEPLFTDNSFRNNGVGLNANNDIGRQGITQIKTDYLKFKVPTLRNIGLTLPYMHDGRYAILEDVIKHYSNINPTTTNLDVALTKKIIFTEKEQQQLILFLYTLTDTSFTKNKRFNM